MKLQTLKGFRDFLPKEAKKRQYVQDKIRAVFESYGFEPLETPALELSDVLKGKYGEEEKLIYEFETRGKDKVAMRYDQTVPLARVVAQYQNEIPMPFKRYQMQNVWRGENPQKGRYREFLQCDADIVGSSSPLSDAEILNLVLSIYKELGLSVAIKINDRKNLEGLDKKYIAAIDKLEKIGESAVLAEMVDKGMADTDAKKALEELQEKPVTDTLKQILNNLEKLGADTSRVKYEPTLARGLDYYTGIIFETVGEGSTASLCSGGRYNSLIGKFAGRDIPAVGLGIGFDRTIEAMEELDLFPKDLQTTKVLVTNTNEKSEDVVKKLRDEGINAELYLEQKDLEKQLRYADKKQIPYCIIIEGENLPAGRQGLILKDMQNRTQESLPYEQILKKLKL